jgi:hypothetical protein
VSRFPAVDSFLLHIKVDILSGIRIPQQYGPGLPEEQVLDAMMLADAAKLLRVLEFKDGHVRS